MKRIFRLACLVILMGITIAPARGEKPFYDSKSWIANVAGDPDFLINNGFQSKVNPIQNLSVPYSLSNAPTEKGCITLAETMTREGMGRKFIDALTNDGKSEEYLQKLALWNANKQDVEFASEHLRGEGEEGIKTLIKDDFEPILQQNYIVLTKTVQVGTTKDGKIKTKSYYAIFHVEVSKEDAYDIMMNIGDAKYYLLKFPVKFCYLGEYNPEEPEKTEANIAKKVPGLAVRGVLLRRNPARISMGEDLGINKGDLVSIYSQRVDKNGNPYSKRISRARVCGVWDNDAQVNFEAGTAGNRKNGDIVVRTPDSHFRWGVLATYSPHVWGGKALMDYKAGFTRSGIIHHILMDLGFNMTDHPGNKYYVLTDKHFGYEYRSPLFFNYGLGYGIGKTFLGYLDVMPFFMLQYEAGVMMDVTTETSTNDDAATILGSSVRIPIGLRLSFNIAYPVKLVVEGGYAARFGFGDDYKIVKQTCDLMKAKRDGVFVNLGLIF
ncbi:MAG: hypothetical protein K2M31_00095 [Muribaculaceae bacterium]|nr:hypothetical protein [Muribaculaceae bacterium]